MSFEGYYEWLCDNGHANVSELYESNMAGWKCKYCNAGMKWWNLVDTTNGSFEGGKRVDGFIALKAITLPETCKCSQCGDVHIGKPAVYKFPANGGHYREQTNE